MFRLGRLTATRLPRAGSLALLMILLVAAFAGAPRRAALAQAEPQFQHMITVAAGGSARPHNVSVAAACFP